MEKPLIIKDEDRKIVFSDLCDGKLQVTSSAFDDVFIVNYIGKENIISLRNHLNCLIDKF